MLVNSSMAASPSPGQRVSDIAIDTVTFLHDARSPSKVAVVCCGVAASGEAYRELLS